ncbi:MAG: acireductone synthase [Gammaproteobacteria bacterium]|nr:acireductone synthase [Gammaproteobacteria bacterium]
MIRAIVTDVEGTTSSLSYVRDTLFPYARERLGQELRIHADDPEWREQVDAVRAELGRSESDGGAGLDEVVETLADWIDADRKATPLKALQGLIWEAGYRRGELRAHMYPDVAGVMRSWHDQRIGIYCYSSGSIHAQRLFFGFSEAGDLTELFSGYFDTTTGPKQEEESYRTIAQAIGCAPREILFLSDIEGELNAASAAGFAVCQVLREGVTPNTRGYATVPDFTHIDITAF